jgi:hypothetical protein
LHLLELFGIGRRKVVGLAEIVREIVKLPSVILEIAFLAEENPRQAMARGGKPSIVKDGAVCEDLETLGGPVTRRVRRVKGVSMLTPANGICAMPLTVSGIGMPTAS